MASFDVPVQPERPEEFLNYPQTPQQPMPNEGGLTKGRALGQAIATGGKDIGEGLELGNQVEQSYISNQMFQQMDTLNRFQINRMETALKGGKVDENGNILGSYADDLPPELKKLPGMVDNLNEMRASGKYSPTYYDMIRDNIAKSMRSQFPGQRDLIDYQFWRHTLQDPANKVIQSLTQDINAYAASMKMEHNKVDSIIAGGIHTGAISGSDYMRYQAGQIPAETMLNRISQRGAADHANAETLKGLEIAAKRDELQKGHATQAFNEVAAREAAISLSEPAMSGDPAWGDPTKINEVNAAIKNGTLQITPEQAVQMRAKGTLIASDYEARMMKHATDIIPYDQAHPEKGGFTLMGVMGPAGIKAAIAEGKAGIVGQWNSLSEGEVPVAKVDEQVTQAHISRLGSQAVQEIPYLGVKAALAKMGGNQPGFVDAVFGAMASDPNAVEGTQKALKHLGTMKLITQPDLGSTGRPFTIADNLTLGQKYGIYQGPFGARTAWDTMDRVAQMMQGHFNGEQVPQQVKTNLAYAIGDPANSKMTQMLDPDGLEYDPSSGAVRIAPGKGYAFGTLFSTKTTDEIHRVGNPTLTKNYLGTLRSNFRDVLAGSGDKGVEDSNLAYLNQFADHPNFQIGWDSEHHLNVFHKSTSKDGFGGLADEQTLARIRFVEERINSSIDALKYADKKLGNQEDTPAYISQMLMDAKLDPRLANVANKLEQAQINTYRIGPIDAPSTMGEEGQVQSMQGVGKPIYQFLHPQRPFEEEPR